ncbi:MAG: Fe-S cluster assembly protein SufD [Acidobacteriota bacterium]
MEALALEKGFAPRLPAVSGGPEWLSELRREAYRRFEDLGFPTPKDEAWRYTGVQPILETAWVPAKRERQLRSLPQGVRIRRLSEALGQAQPHIGKIAEFAHGAFAALNTAALDDALVLEILPGTVVAEPIELVFTATGAARPEVSYPRILILAGEGSQASVVESYSGDGRYFTDAVTEVALSAGAILEHYKLQQESVAAFHVHTLAARLGRSSRFTSHNIALGGALARTDIHVTLDAEGAECTLNGLFVGAGTQHIDNHTVIDHAKPRCASRELYKGVMDGASRGVFHGTIIVRPDAQKTDAIQTNKNLLLSREALVNSTPALEIFADDVKCKHGSTTGQLDAAALFYLRARGIGETEARALLTYAFAADVANRITVPAIRALVEEKLGLLLTGAPAEARS